MEKNIIKAQSISKESVVAWLMGVAQSFAEQLPQSVSQGFAASNECVASWREEIRMIDEKLPQLKTLEERAFYLERRDAACAAIDAKDRQNKAYGLVYGAATIGGTCFVVKTLVSALKRAA